MAIDGHCIIINRNIKVFAKTNTTLPISLTIRGCSPVGRTYGDLGPGVSARQRGGDGRSLRGFTT